MYIMENSILYIIEKYTINKFFSDIILVRVDTPPPTRSILSRSGVPTHR
jgi:hypothetical protein